MLKLKPQYFGHLVLRTNSLEKTLIAGKDWGQEEKGATEDEMVGWHHQLNGHEFEQSPGDSEEPDGLQSLGSQKVRCLVSEQQQAGWTHSLPQPLRDQRKGRPYTWSKRELELSLGFSWTNAESGRLIPEGGTAGYWAAAPEVPRPKEPAPPALGDGTAPKSGNTQAPCSSRSGVWERGTGHVVLLRSRQRMWN